MPILQVRELPDDVYAQLNYLAEKDRRSLAQETIVLLREGIDSRLRNKEPRRKLLDGKNTLGLIGKNYPDPVTLIREDRER